MFDYLLLIFGKSILTNAIEFLFQSCLFFSVYKYSKLKTLLWEKICQKLAMFLFLETLSQFLFVLNSTYIGFTIPTSIRFLIVGLTTIPLFALWISLPDLLVRSNKSITNSNEHNEKLIKGHARSLISSNSDVTTRLVKALHRIDKNCVINV